MNSRTWRRAAVAWAATLLGSLALVATARGQTGKPSAPMEFVRVAADGRTFELAESGRPFVPWGFNYDHDEAGRLLEDYWDAEWDKVAADFAEMAELGANCVRIHLQFGKFMSAADSPNQAALDRLGKLLVLAERTGLYLDLTGLGCYHKADVPAWYDALLEADRWQAQCRFWEAVAAKCAASPAVFCYDLMNEPVVPGGKRSAGDWLGPPFAGKHFVQFIALDQAGRTRPDVARAWVATLAAAVRKHDPRHLTTVGLVDWSLDRPGLSSGFVPAKIAEPLDFLCVHVYPETGKTADALETLAGFRIGKPVVIEETFSLRCSWPEFRDFLDSSAEHATGWIGFYWGKTLPEYRRAQTLGDAIMAQWLGGFTEHGPPLPRAVVQRSVQKAVDALAREVAAWRADHACFSCHNNADAVRALSTAHLAGFAFEKGPLQETFDWLKRPADWKNNGGDREFSDQRLACLQFAGALKSTLDAGLTGDRGPLVQAAERLAAFQDDSGGWPTNATSAVGSSIVYGAALATWQARDVLRAAGADDYRDRIARANDWLRQCKSANTVDAASVAVALAGQADDASAASRRRAFEFLAAAQNSDGGWGPYRASGSEAFDTALALLAWSTADNHETRQRAQTRGRWFSIREQHSDGLWLESTRPAGGVSYAQQISTTAWATLGLLAP